MLHTRINTFSASELDGYLHSMKEHVRPNKLIELDHQGKTPLHLAIDSGDFDKVELLLNYGAPLSCMLGEQSIHAYAQQYGFTESGKKIAALIANRQTWSLSVREDLSLADTFRIIKNYTKLEVTGTTKASLLVVGVTGEGKSTLINYLSGVNYKKERSRGRWVIKPADDASAEIARVGHSTTSETSMPEVHDIATEHPAVIELPGFEDTRGHFAELSAAVGMQLMIPKIKDIQGIVLVCSQRSLDSPRMLEFRQSAYSIGSMASQDPTVLNNITLVVTKGDDEISEDDVREILQKLLEDEELSLESETLIERNQCSEEAFRKQCLGLTLRSILTNQNNIIITDVTSGHARSMFWELTNRSDCHPKPARLFDFSHYSRSLCQFISHLHHLLRGYQALYDQAQETTCEVSRISQQKINLTQEKEGLVNRIKAPIASEEHGSIKKNIKRINYQLKVIKYDLDVLEINREALREEYQDQKNLLANAEQLCANVCYSEAQRLANLGDYAVLNDYREREQRVSRYNQTVSKLESELRIMDHNVIILNDSLQEQNTLLVASQVQYQKQVALNNHKRQMQEREVAKLEQDVLTIEHSLKELSDNIVFLEITLQDLSYQVNVSLDFIKAVFNVATLLGEDMSMYTNPLSYESTQDTNDVDNDCAEVVSVVQETVSSKISFFSNLSTELRSTERMTPSYHQPR